MEKKYHLFLCLFLGSHEVLFNKGIEGFVFYFQILVFQYFIKWESIFKFSHILQILELFLSF